MLNDVTGPEVKYPGLTDSDEVEDVLSALNRMAEELQQFAVQLTRHLDDELDAGRLVMAPGSSYQEAESGAVARRPWPTSVKRQDDVSHLGYGPDSNAALRTAS